MQIATIGLDTSKHVFQVHGVDAKGRVVCRRKLRTALVMLLLRRFKEVVYR